MKPRWKLPTPRSINHPGLEDSSLRNRCPALFPVLEAIEQFRMPASQRQQTPVDKQVHHVRSRLENVTVGDDDVRDLPDLDRAEAIGDAEYLRRVERHGF